MSNNPFLTYAYSFGGWGGTFYPWTKYSVLTKNQLLTRAGNETPIACTDGFFRTKPGFKANVYFLKSLHKDDQDRYDDSVFKSKDFHDEHVTFIEVPKGTNYVCITISKDDNTQEFTQSEVDNLYGMAFEYIPSYRTYATDGTISISQYSNDIFIKNIRDEFPNYNDDELLDEAIIRVKAKGNGKASRIIWDGRDIYFAGSTTHVCSGFGGIDFNGSKIYMPDYDTDLATDYPPVIIKVVPDKSVDVVANASEFTKYSVTNNDLKDKIFTMNSVYSGNSGMCLGKRQGFDTTLYYAPTVRTMPDGGIYTSPLYLVPSSGNVSCYNVHDYPDVTFEISNGIVMTVDSQNMSCLVQCNRSNTHLHNFALIGSRQDVTSYHSRYLFSFEKCAYIEIDHVSGLNPIHTTSGYVLELSSITNAYVHDCHIGDSAKWGVMGCHYLTNGTFERCSLNRWDCHYAQFGHNVIKECKLDCVSYGIGDGILSIENTLFMHSTASFSPNNFIVLRQDVAGCYDGDIIIKGCAFKNGPVNPNNIVLVDDSSPNAKGTGSVVNVSPTKERRIENCDIPDGIGTVIKTGSAVAQEYGDFENLSLFVKGSKVNCYGVIFDTTNEAQGIKKVVLEDCDIVNNNKITETLSDCILEIRNCIAENKTLSIKKNSGLIYVCGSNIGAISSTQQSAALVMVGNNITGTIDLTKFTMYSLAGNVSSNMASVNTHSN